MRGAIAGLVLGFSGCLDVEVPQNYVSTVTKLEPPTGVR